MSSIHSFSPGDFLIFQLESGYALLRVLNVENTHGDEIWHLTAYRDLFLDPDAAGAALDRAENLGIEIPHVALTTRAFESTQVAKMGHSLLKPDELSAYQSWKESEDRQVSDRSIRLLLGWR